MPLWRSQFWENFNPPLVVTWFMNAPLLTLAYIIKLADAMLKSKSCLSKKYNPKVSIYVLTLVLLINWASVNFFSHQIIFTTETGQPISNIKREFFNRFSTFKITLQQPLKNICPNTLGYNLSCENKAQQEVSQLGFCFSNT